MQTLTTGSLLQHGAYQIDKVLGQGGFGITYLATDINLQRKVAIKEFFPKDFCDRDEATSHVTLGTRNTAEFVNRLKAKFLKEARNIAKFDHPNIIRILAAFEENNTAYYVMEYIEGESLSSMVKRCGPLPEKRASGYVEKVGRALEYVHARKVNHLDVKPANVMVRQSDDTPILIDFGLSKQYDSEGNQTSTMPPGFSHGFAPLEQYSDGGVKEFSPQTDLYSLAATLYYILSGIVPIQATRRNDEELSFPGSIPQRLVAPISKAMSPARKNRHETVARFLDELAPEHANREEEATVLRNESHVSGGKSGQEGPSRPDSQPDGKSRKTPYLIASFAVLAVFVIGLLLGRGDRPQPAPDEDAPQEEWILPADSLYTDEVVNVIPTKDRTETEQAEGRSQKQQEAEARRRQEAEAKQQQEAEARRRQEEAAKQQQAGRINGHEYVDLGLPSGLKWATCNVGASTPADYGNYYAWGETAPKSTYTWSNCFDCLDDSGDSWGVYKLGGRTRITPTSGHDTARENWGGTWRMPTTEEFQELNDKCSWAWTSQGGHDGYRVTGPNGRSIFLPAAGWRGDSDSYGVGSSGYYWSSALSSSISYDARSLHFGDGHHDTINGTVRRGGQSVRPVTE